MIARPSLALMPLAVPINGSGSAVPLCLYPPGFDMSSFVILDPLTGESINGSQDTTSAFALNSSQFDGFEPLGSSSGGSGDPMPQPETGFYQVVRDGVHIFGLTNGAVLSGTVQFPVEFAVSSTDEIVGVVFYDENNSPIIGASAQGVGNGWPLTWNTPMSFNGSYNIYAELDFATDNPVISVPVTVTVSNVISFPNYLSQTFGSQMWIFAQTIPNAAYEIDIYDENTNYLGSFLDNADSSGYISFLWDLTDYNGNPSDSTNFYGVFTVDTSSLQAMQVENHTNCNLSNYIPGFQKLISQASGNGVHPNAGGSSASVIHLWVKEPAWTPNNNWVVGYASLTGNSTTDASIQYMIVGGVASPTDYGGVLGTLDPEGLNGNLSPGNNAQGGTVFTLHDSTTRSNLLSYLADHRYENFYFLSHGNESSISAYAGSGTVITRDQIVIALDNVPLSYSILHAAMHPYRFVWIDACSIGSGNFCEAFGIPAFPVSTNVFAASGLESRVFIGFTKPTGFDASNSSGDYNSWPNRSIMIAGVLEAWVYSAANVQTIVYNAQQGNLSSYKMDSSAVVYGAYDLLSNTRTRP